MRKVSCVVRGCSSKTGEGISMFKFPREIDRIKEWLKACNREDLLPKTKALRYNYKICEFHFEDKHKACGNRRRLFDQATPTIFAHPEVQVAPKRSVENVTKESVTRDVRVVADLTKTKVGDTHVGESPPLLDTNEFDIDWSEILELGSQLDTSRSFINDDSLIGLEGYCSCLPLKCSCIYQQTTSTDHHFLSPNTYQKPEVPLTQHHSQNSHPSEISMLLKQNSPPSEISMLHEQNIFDELYSFLNYSEEIVRTGTKHEESLNEQKISYSSRNFNCNESDFVLVKSNEVVFPTKVLDLSSNLKQKENMDTDDINNIMQIDQSQNRHFNENSASNEVLFTLQILNLNKSTVPKAKNESIVSKKKNCKSAISIDTNKFLEKKQSVLPDSILLSHKLNKSAFREEIEDSEQNKQNKTNNNNLSHIDNVTKSDSGNIHINEEYNSCNINQAISKNILPPYLVSTKGQELFKRQSHETNTNNNIVTSESYNDNGTQVVLNNKIIEWSSSHQNYQDKEIHTKQCKDLMSHEEYHNFLSGCDDKTNKSTVLFSDLDFKVLELLCSSYSLM